MKITYGELVLDIADREINDRLSVLDRDGNQNITPADFPNEALFKRHVSYALIYPDGKYKTEEQIEGVQEFFDLYTRVSKLHEVIEGAKKKHYRVKNKNSIKTSVAYFKAQDWEALRPHLIQGGFLSQSNLKNLSNGLYTTYQKLGRKDATLPEGITSNCTRGQYIGFSYDEEKMPTPLRPFLAQTAKKYTEAMQWFSQFNLFTCDNTCPEFSGVTIQAGAYFRTVHAGIISMLTPCGGSTCFTGESYLRTIEGGLITFAELSRLNSQGRPLPQLASLNEADGAVVFQTPTRLIDHGIMQSALVYLRAQNRAGEIITLKVTKEHPLWVERDGTKSWIKVGDLKEGDQLVGEGGINYSFDSKATTTTEGAFHLYDLNFSNGSPTYLVSPDGVHWLVAHNKQIQ